MTVKPTPKTSLAESLGVTSQKLKEALVHALLKSFLKMEPSRRAQAFEQMRVEARKFSESEEQGKRLLRAVLEEGSLEEFEELVARKPPPGKAILFLAESLMKKAGSERGSPGGRARSENLKAAKNYILADWARNKNAYEGKAVYGRIMASLVQKEFPDVRVTSRTISEEWLPKTGSA